MPANLSAAAPGQCGARRQLRGHRRRPAFGTIAQTEPLAQRPIKTPVVALGGVKGLGAKVGPMVARIAERVEAHTLEHCGHFIPEECPETIVQHVIALA